MSSLEILENFSGTFEFKIPKLTPQPMTKRPFLINIILKHPIDREYNVPGPDPNVQPPKDIPETIGNYPYLTCAMCANLQTFLDVHKMATYLCYSTGDFIIHPGSHEVCETFLPLPSEEE